MLATFFLTSSLQKRPAYNEGQEKLNKLATVYNDLLHKFLACQQELHQKVVKKRQKEQPTAVQNTAQVSQEIYEMPPDINSFGATASTVASGFGDSFSPNPPPFAQCKRCHALSCYLNDCF